MLRNPGVTIRAVSTTEPSHAPLPSSPTAARLSGGIKVRRACELHLEQLMLQLPIRAAWMVYQTPDRGQCKVRVTSAHVQAMLDPQILSYLESEAWLVNSLPMLKLSELVLEQQHCYVCLLGRLSSHCDYLLLWTQEPLVAGQQHLIEQQAQLLNYWLIADREISRQQGEIQLLEQIVQKAEHQLRNPLAVISLYAENLRLGLPEGALQEQATLIRDTVSELSTNLTDLIHCGQRSKLRVSTYDLRHLLIESLRGVQPWLQQKHLQVHYPDTPLAIGVDGWQMKQVLSNLLNNAIHFSPPESTVTWNWCGFQHEVLIEVRDQGPGLSEEDLQNAFTPFYSRRPGGTGLGLAIAKKIILDHQGSLWVQNLASGGAQFSFTLPRN